MSFTSYSMVITVGIAKTLISNRIEPRLDPGSNHP
jgi:hypothetical protein